jgi:hypothetical protein
MLHIRGPTLIRSGHLLPSREKVDRPKAETDEGEATATILTP